MGVAEPLHDLEQEPRLVELRHGVVEVELLEHLAHVGAEPADVVAQVLRDVGGVGEQLLEVVARRVVEGEPRGPPELRVEVVELAPEPGLDGQDLLLGGGQHPVEPAQHGEGQDDVLVLAALLKVSRMRSATPQMKLTLWLWFMCRPLWDTAGSSGTRHHLSAGPAQVLVRRPDRPPSAHAPSAPAWRHST